MLDEITNIAQEHHFVRNGLIMLGIAFAIIIILKSAAGKWWWRHKEDQPKRSALRDKYNRQKYGIE